MLQCLLTERLLGWQRENRFRDVHVQVVMLQVVRRLIRGENASRLVAASTLSELLRTLDRQLRLNIEALDGSLLESEIPSFLC